MLDGAVSIFWLWGVGSAFTLGLLVFGQSPDPVLGGFGAAGWAGAILNGSVLAWLLLVHLPAKDKQIMTLIKDCDAHNEKQRLEHLAEQKEARLKFDSTLRFIAEKHTEQIRAVTGARQHDRHAT